MSNTHAHPLSICWSHIFGAFVTQVLDDREALAHHLRDRLHVAPSEGFAIFRSGC